MARLQRSLGLGALCVLVAVLASPTQLSGVVAHPAPVGGAVSDPAGPSHTAVVQGASASASSSAHEMNPSVSSPSESVAVGNGMNALASRYDTVMAETINALLEFYDQPGDEAPSLDHLQELALQWNPELRQLQEQIAATSIDQPSESIAASSNPHAVEQKGSLLSAPPEAEFSGVDAEVSPTLAFKAERK
ncbi:hypothetical protein CXG81DRAFT_17281 [Caulochytrium protostelioides]|uniref:Uncharacterized protein n=1 Tax=Caulochytrium protostelioides TaxID=1555241 RepID=A0A4P9XCE0_9FUNG|nr:hypothetical protein CXG81DRAFT_17281 [Caulochytrium protostelioides]|eukprot:RKP03117.1 hypothetical protein CXG81DRAFT_17281 [Caulochytrium protostelioides]